MILFTPYELLPVAVRGCLHIWILALQYALLFLLFRYIQRGRWWVRFITPGFLLAFSFMLQEFLLAADHVMRNRDAVQSTAGVPFLTMPVGLLIAVYGALTVCIRRLLRESRQWQQTHITAMSVKEGVDSLPTGLMYCWNDGRIKLFNRKMKEVAEGLTGLSLQNGRAFMAGIREGQAADGDPALQLPDGSSWSFHHRETKFQGETLHELIASDVTEEYRLHEELEAENRRLQDMNRRLRHLNEMIGEITVEKETLAAKIRIHDETGRTMLATRRYLESEDSGIELEELLNMWDLVCRIPSDPRPAWSDMRGSLLEDLREAAEAIGLKLEVSEETPEETGAEDPQKAGAKDAPEQKSLLERPKVRKLLTAGARECLTNAYRHAGAGCLRIGIARDPESDAAVITFTNDGRVPEGPLREGGGLSSLRRTAEAEGAEMKLDYQPAFCLTLEIPPAS